MATETVEQLRYEWKEAKKVADSLTIDFNLIDAARIREIEARKRYVYACHGSGARPS